MRMPTIRRAVPSAITLAGLVLAFWSLVLTDEGRFETAAWVVFASGLVDTFDGPAARALGVISGFGRQLDSLVDLVAAGVAPAFLVYQVYFEPWGFIGMLVATSWIGFVAARLARFNSSPGHDPLHFVGFPCPIAATVVAQYLVFNRATFDDDGPAWGLALIICALGLLMLSNVPYWKAATVMPSQFLKHPYGPGVAATAVSSIVFPRQAVFFWVSVSFVAAVAGHAVRLLAHAVDPGGVSGPSNSPRTG